MARTFVPDEIDLASIFCNAKSVILHAGAPSDIPQHQELYPCIMSSLVRHHVICPAIWGRNEEHDNGDQSED